MIYGRPPFAEFAPFQKMQKITDPNYEINYPSETSVVVTSIESNNKESKVDPDVLEVMKLCLQREPKKRPTIPELLRHRFLSPETVKFDIMDGVIQKKENILALMEQVKRLDP
ncbi:hypothetical protein HK096_008826, partial [Nowakowskiella sp. JEL0078]